MTAPIAGPHAELSSLSGALDELTARIRALGEAADTDGDDAVATELFEIERSLHAGRRRLARLADTIAPQASGAGAG